MAAIAALVEKAHTIEAQQSGLGSDPNVAVAVLGDGSRGALEHTVSEGVFGVRVGREVVEVGEIGVESLTTAWKVFTGTAEEAAQAQVQLQESIKQIPIVGRALSSVTTTAGDWVAKLFGKQTVSE